MKVTEKQLNVFIEKIIKEMIAGDPMIDEINHLLNDIGNVSLKLKRKKYFSHEEDTKECLEYLEAVEEILNREWRRRMNRGQGGFR
jgi:hypothetical protein